MTDISKNPASKIPAVLCLAAGSSQVVVINKSRQLGYAVIAVDRNPDAPGFSECAEKIVASTYESGPIITALDPLLARYDVVGVINRSSGLPVIAAAEICQALGLPSPTPTAAATITDKARLMAACRDAGIDAPICQSVCSGEKIDDASITYPCVVKPAISLVGKSGITVVKQASDLTAAVAEAERTSLNGKVNIEEFLPGSDVSLTALVADGKIQPIVLKDELTGITPDGRIRFDGVAVPSVFSGQEEENKILKLAQQLVAEFSLGKTVINVSCRCEPGGRPKLIEVHLDLGGDAFYEGLVPQSTTTDILGLLIDFLAGATTEFPTPKFTPTALVFAPGSEPQPGRPYSVLKADTGQDLATRISAWLNS